MDWQELKFRVLRAIVRFFLPFRIPEELVILREVLDDIQYLAKAAYPNEVVAFLNGTIKKEDGKLIAFVDGLSVIQYRANHYSTSFSLYDIPIIGVVGSVHSHPSPSTRPSRADLKLFSSFGWVHGIIGRPYQDRSISVYDKQGAPFPWRIEQ